MRFYVHFIQVHITLHYTIFGEMQEYCNPAIGFFNANILGFIGIITLYYTYLCMYIFYPERNWPRILVIMGPCLK
jgi:hypothetical protein